MFWSCDLRTHTVHWPCDLWTHTVHWSCDLRTHTVHWSETDGLLMHVLVVFKHFNNYIPSHSLSLSSPADTYLLQIQPYNFSGSAQKPKTEGTTIKADADQSEAGNVVAPATGQKEAVPQWYDVEVVKGTQFTVTGYNIPSETPPTTTPTPATPTTANGQEVCSKCFQCCDM